MKTILITGATDGIGLLTARKLLELGHRVLVHGRNPKKLQIVSEDLSAAFGDRVETLEADLSVRADVERLADQILERSEPLDVLINNAGVFKTGNPDTPSGLDVRFVVNTLSPYLLAKSLLPAMAPDARIVNLSSAAQAPINLDALAKGGVLPDNAAYAQSKLAITMWSQRLAADHSGPVIVAVNPGSLLASKMVRDAYGISGSDLSIGADILVEAALEESFANASGRYYDNDNKAFALPHPDAANPVIVDAVMISIEKALSKF